ncbi:hypothetical protein ACROYT_G038411 [Oculina patagonica]
MAEQNSEQNIVSRSLASQTKGDVKKQKRKENQGELGVCRIRRSERDQSSQTLGSGFVVKDLEIIPGFCCPYCLISSDKVFPKDDFNIRSYSLDFRKLESTKFKTIKLEEVAAKSLKSTDVHRTSGLVVIPINPSKKYWLYSQKDSIFTYRPFKVAKEGIKPDDDLSCYYVDDVLAELFAVKCLKMKQSDVPGQYELHEANEPPHKTYAEVTRKGYRKPYGAVILKRRNNEFMVAGALTFTEDECKKISPVFFPLPLGPCETAAPEGKPVHLTDEKTSTKTEDKKPKAAAGPHETAVPEVKPVHLTDEKTSTETEDKKPKAAAGKDDSALHEEE